MKVLAPYFIVVVVSLAAMYWGGAGEKVIGYYYMLIFNIVSYLFVATAVIFLHLKENRV
jgi:hypothetical protein